MAPATFASQTAIKLYRNETGLAREEHDATPGRMAETTCAHELADTDGRRTARAGHDRAGDSVPGDARNRLPDLDPSDGTSTTPKCRLGEIFVLVTADDCPNRGVPVTKSMCFGQDTYCTARVRNGGSARKLNGRK